MVNLVKEEYLQKVPEWYLSNEKFELVLSDDIDSLVTTSVVQTVKPNWSIEYFYDFDNIYVSEELKDRENKSRTRVWCDVAVIKDEMAFDNHISRKNIEDYCNPRCINPNILANVTNYGYTNKYAGSTALLVWSLYNIPLPKTEEGKLLLLAIDSTFKGYYSDKFRGRNKFFLCDVLGLEELYEVEGRHTIKEFYQIISKYGLSKKIRYKKENMNIETGLDLELIGEVLGIELKLPQKKNFVHWRSFEQRQGNMIGMRSVKELGKTLVTLAFTFKNVAKYSVVCKPAA
jgi:hypothetical protein